MAGGLRFGILITGISLLVLFALFNLTWIHASMAGRFVLFVPLILVPLTAATAWPHLPRVTTVVTALAILPLIYWLGSWGTRQFTLSLADTKLPGEFRAGQRLHIARLCGRAERHDQAGTADCARPGGRNTRAPAVSAVYRPSASHTAGSVMAHAISWPKRTLSEMPRSSG